MRAVSAVWHCLIATAAIVVGRSSPVFAGEFADLSHYLPSDANALVVVNAQSLYESPLGQRENWRQRFHDASEVTPLLLPPEALQCVLAARIDIDTLQPDWEGAAMKLNVDPSIADVARRHNGTVDAVGSYDAAWLPPRMCVVKFAPRIFGVLTPATRQEASRWAAEVASPEVEPLSPYLQQSLSYADSVGTQIILAVDLVDALPTASIRARVAESKLLDALPEDETVALLTGIQGVKLGVVVRDKLTGKLQLDFAGNTEFLAPVAKPLIISILGEAGAMLDEFKDWRAEAKGNSLSISGDLTMDGLRRLMSLLAVDASAASSEQALPAAGAVSANTPTPAAGIPPNAPPSKDAVAKASQIYFRAVAKYVADAQKLNRADSLRQSVMWLQNYARRVENLPTRGVDPELVKYGQYVAQTFRWVIDQAYGVEDKYAQIDELSGPSEVRTGVLPTARTVNWGGYYMREYAPYSWVQYNKQEQLKSAADQQKISDEIAKSVEEARQTLSKLIADQETARSAMSQRYGVQF